MAPFSMHFLLELTEASRFNCRYFRFQGDTIITCVRRPKTRKRGLFRFHNDTKKTQLLLVKEYARHAFKFHNGTK